MQEVEKAWLAAAIDGEGTISIAKRYPQTNSGNASTYYEGYVQLSNACREFVERAKELTASGYLYVSKVRTGRHQASHSWKAKNHKAAQIVEEILPYLIVKREQAKTLLELTKLIGKWRKTPGEITRQKDDLRNRILALNSAKGSGRWRQNGRSA